MTANKQKQHKKFFFCTTGWNVLDFLGFFSKLLMLLLKVTEVTTEHQKWPKVSQNSIKSPFFARRAKKTSAGGRSPPQELEVKPA